MNLRLESAAAKRSVLWVTSGVLWLGALAVGFAMLVQYANSPGQTQQTPLRWPSTSKIALSDRRATLVLFAHPHCPCTRASVGELEKIVARCQDAATYWVVFFKPTGASDDWDDTDLWRTAAAIPGVHVTRDPGGEEARRFHVVTSGQVLLYSDGGSLLFSGGITFARGHSGDNVGRAAIESYLTGVSSGIRQTAVFGCPIVSTFEQEED